MDYSYYFKKSGGYNIKDEQVYEYEFQCVLPDSFIFMIIYKNLIKHYDYKLKGYLIGKEVNTKTSYRTKIVKRKYTNDINNIDNDKKFNIEIYKKRYIKVLHCYTSLDISTTYRTSLETKINKYFNNVKSRSKIYIRFLFESVHDSNIELSLTLSMNTHGNDINFKDINNMTKIFNIIDDPSKHFIMISSQKMFSNVLEMELKKEGDFKKYKKHFLEILENTYSRLAIMNINTKITENYIENKSQYLPHSLKNRNILSKPSNLNIIDFKRDILTNTDKFCISPKADGIHYFILVSKDNSKPCIVFSEKSIYVYKNFKRWESIQVDDIFEKNKIHDFSDFSLFEGELINNRLLIFDYFNNIDNNISLIYYDIISKNIPNVELKPKLFLKDNYEENIKKVVNSTYWYPTDGIIFSKCDDPDYTYKWKPFHTVDFIIYCHDDKKEMQLLSISNKGFIKKLNLTDKCREIYDRLNIDYDMYNIVLTPFMIPYKKKYIPPSHILNENYDITLHGKIAECNFDINNGWNFIRIRDDKAIPNNFYVAIMSFLNNINNITIDMLIDPVSNINMFFSKERDSRFESVRFFNSNVRKSLIKNNITIDSNILDLGSGRGNAFFDMLNLNPKSITLNDNDDSAITEFFIRFLKNDNRKNRFNNFGNLSNTEINIIKGSFIDIDDIENMNLNNENNLIFCSFAIHFAFSSDSSLDNFIKLINKAASSKCIFIVLAIDGKTLFNKLKNNDGEYLIKTDEDILKYKFISNYGDTAKFNGCGYSIDVLYPFSDENKLNKEFLTHFEYLIDKMKNIGFEVKEDKFFNEGGDKSLYEKLKQEDKDYTSLHRYLIFSK